MVLIVGGAGRRARAVRGRDRGPTRTFLTSRRSARPTPGPRKAGGTPPMARVESAGRPRSRWSAQVFRSRPDWPPPRGGAVRAGMACVVVVVDNVDPIALPVLGHVSGPC